MKRGQVTRQIAGLTCLLTWVCFVATTNAGMDNFLDTDAHVGTDGTGSTVDNGGGSYTVFDETGVGDIWTTGDDFQYFYGSTPVNGDFSAKVRVVSQTEEITGRWGKAGLMVRADPLATDSAFVMFEQHTGNERLAAPPEDGNGDAPRLMWRTTTGQADTIERIDFLSAPAPLPPEADGAPIWFRIDRTGDVFTSWWSDDGAVWQDEFSTGSVPDLAGGVTIGLGYSGGGSSPPGQHGVTFDSFSVVPEPSSMVMAMLGLLGVSLFGSRRRR